MEGASSGTGRAIPAGTGGTVRAAGGWFGHHDDGSPAMKTILAAALILAPTLASAQTADPAPATTERGGGLLASDAAGCSAAAARPGRCRGSARSARAMPPGCSAIASRTGCSATGGGTSGAAGVLGRLTGQEGCAEPAGLCRLARRGRCRRRAGQALSLDGLRGQVKNQVCNLVLNRAKAFL